MADFYISAGKADKVLIVSAVFGGEMGDAAVIKDMEDIGYKFAGLEWLHQYLTLRSFAFVNFGVPQKMCLRVAC